jgi:hypothetical protein
MATPALPVGGAARPGPPLLRVVTPQQMVENDRLESERAREALKSPEDVTMTNLASFVRTEWEMMRNHRNSSVGWNERLLNAQRVFNGEYSAEKLSEIRKFGGSEVYARVVGLKCRGATALLREVYLKERPWGLDPTPEPTLPDSIMDSVGALVNLEVQQLAASGQPLDLNAIRDRTNILIAAAKRAARKRAKTEAKAAEEKLDDILVEGGFYYALTEFLTDLPLFPYAVMKGPVVRVVPDVVWQQGKPVTQNKAKMFWHRLSPFDVYWTPGVSNMKDAAIIERQRLTRADLNDIIDLPGYNKENILAVLTEHGRGGLHDWLDSTDQQRSEGENRESPAHNRSGLIDCVEYHGNVQGRTLREYGFTADDIPDEMRDYFVQVWLIGRYVIKAQLSPNVRKRHPYYITSFEKVPGTPVGNALPDILEDIQDVCNATLRSLVNNLSIASGPQVVVDEERLSINENPDEMYPWKRWRTRSDPMAGQNNTIKPVDFFSPSSHAQELLGVYQAFVSIADELSAIPRYITGSEKIGGAGRTASGLAMLMGNASKILQMVASNIDSDVMRGMLEDLYDMVMLTDQTGAFRGDETIRVRGVEVAVQRETNRQRQLEALQATANPIDMSILGPEGRAKLLRSVLSTVGIEDEIVPGEDELQAKIQGPPGGIPGQPPGVPQVTSGVSPPPAGANTDPGVQEAGAMRGMAGGGRLALEDGGLVIAPAQWEVNRDETGRIVGFKGIRG